MEGMHRANDVMVIQTSQLRQIKNLEDQVQILMNKVTEQDCIIAQLVGDNLNHLQANTMLTTHIDSSQTRMGNLECWLEELGELLLVVMGQSSLEAGTQESGGDNEDNQDGGEDNMGAGTSLLGNMRPLTPTLREMLGSVPLAQ